MAKGQAERQQRGNRWRDGPSVRAGCREADRAPARVDPSRGLRAATGTTGVYPEDGQGRVASSGHSEPQRSSRSDGAALCDRTDLREEVLRMQLRLPSETKRKGCPAASAETSRRRTRAGGGGGRRK